MEIEQNIVGAMILALTAEPDREPLGITRRLQAFERARDYIEANLAGPLGLELLARDYRERYGESPAKTLSKHGTSR